MKDAKKCLCGAPKRREQEWCDECHEGREKCKTGSERADYFIQKTKNP